MRYVHIFEYVLRNERKLKWILLFDVLGDLKIFVHTSKIKVSEAKFRQLVSYNVLKIV